jgi:CRP-like cAMP-binding protein
MIEEFEILFTKEVLSKGFIIQKQDEQDDYLYLIYKGSCRVLYSTCTKDTELFPDEIQRDTTKRHLVLTYLNRGSIFGDHSSMNDLSNPYTIEAYS